MVAVADQVTPDGVDAAFIASVSDVARKAVSVRRAKMAAFLAASNAEPAFDFDE